jgi:hypothetical protein
VTSAGQRVAAAIDIAALGHEILHKRLLFVSSPINPQGVLKNTATKEEQREARNIGEKGERILPCEELFRRSADCDRSTAISSAEFYGRQKQSILPLVESMPKGVPLLRWPRHALATDGRSGVRASLLENIAYAREFFHPRCMNTSFGVNRITTVWKLYFLGNRL